MAETTYPQPVQLLTGVILGDMDILGPVEQELERRLSAIEAKSPAYPFEATTYYGEEMGDGLKRILYAFKDLVSPETIVEIKLATNEIECEFATDGKRRINIDPGYMDFHKLVLASAKFLGQKIYLGKGIYADPTLYYDKGWKPYKWGFPDFRSGRYNEFLTRVRGVYKEKIRSIG